MIEGLNGVLQAFMGTSFTWMVTALGASLVYIVGSMDRQRKILDASLGFAGGVMTAASFWSLLAPAIDVATERGDIVLIPIVTGFILGGAFVYLADVLISYAGVSEEKMYTYLATTNPDEDEDAKPPDGQDADLDDNMISAKSQIHVHFLDEDQTTNDALEDSSDDEPSADHNHWTIDEENPQNRLRNRIQGPQRMVVRRTGPPDVAVSSQSLATTMDEATSISSESSSSSSSIDERGNWRRILLLVLAITVHNIPEGLAVGIGFGAIGQHNTTTATFQKARNLALGIGIQNFPEGLAVSVPLHASGFPLWAAFCWGHVSGLVEPMSGVLGALLVSVATPVLPYALAFAAGAMIFVVYDDIIPEAQKCGNGKLASSFGILGFTIMMSLDVSLG